MRMTRPLAHLQGDFGTLHQPAITLSEFLMTFVSANEAAGFNLECLHY